MKSKITEQQFNWLVEKGIIHENMMIYLFNCDYIDYKIKEIIRVEGKTPILKVQNMENDDMSMVSFNHITGIEYMDAERFVKAYEVDDVINTINVEENTDVCNTIIGKESASISGIELSDGMKIILKNDSTNKFNNKTLTVKGVGSSIKLVAPRGRPKKIK